MRRFLFIFVVFLMVRCAAAQECTSHVVVNLYEPKLAIDIQTATAKDFDARTDNKPLQVTSASQNYTSRLLVLLEIDGADNDSIAERIETVTLMARQAPAGQPVAFGVFSDRAVFTKGFITDPKERHTAISAVREEGGSLGKRVAMYDALLEGLKLFGEHQPGDALLLVGFPYDDKSRNGPGKVEHEFMASGVRLLVMLRERLSSNSRDFLFNNHPAEKALFDNLPPKTGGAYTDFDPHFFAWVWRGYMLDIKQPDVAHASRQQKWKLKLQGPAKENFRRARLFYPDLLPPCRVGTK